MNKKKKTALISVHDKEGLPELGNALEELGYRILSTGGTAKLLEESGVKVTQLSDYTGFPEMLDGRVKSLHPKVHAGLLALREDPEHLTQLSEAGIEPIDILVVNLYPFRDKARSGDLGPDELLEFIDIGGVAMLRAGAKNFKNVLVLSDPSDYEEAIKGLRRGGVPEEVRRGLARKAFALTTAYDGAISRFLGGGEGGEFPERLGLDYSRLFVTRYGENPHQRAAVYGTEEERAGSSVIDARQLSGGELSYNNMLDLESALGLVLELEGKAAVVIKHNNPCGAAESVDLLKSYLHARLTDPVSAFGSVVALSGEVDEKLAEELTSTFVEVVIAPAYTSRALEILARKKKLRVLETGALRERPPFLNYRSIYGGLLVQDDDGLGWEKDKLKVATEREPTDGEWKDLFFAWKVCKHTRSNAVILARGGQTIGVGAGQMSRIDAARLAATKAEQAGFELSGSVLASDAFFPFRDVVDFCGEAGVAAFVQPGGSIRDEESIRAADEKGLAMIFTGVRHFRH